MQNAMVMHFKADVGLKRSSAGYRKVSVFALPGLSALFLIEEMERAPADIMLRFITDLDLIAILVWRQKWR
jgi:hypothetical protein